MDLSDLEYRRFYCQFKGYQDGNVELKIKSPQYTNCMASPTLYQWPSFSVTAIDETSVECLKLDVLKTHSLHSVIFSHHKRDGSWSFQGGGEGRG